MAVALQTTGTIQLTTIQQFLLNELDAEGFQFSAGGNLDNSLSQFNLTVNRNSSFIPNQTTVAADCTLAFDDGTLPSHHTAPRGFVNSDGRILVIVSFDSPRDSASANDALAQLIVGFRKP